MTILCKSPILALTNVAQQTPSRILPRFFPFVNLNPIFYLAYAFIASSLILSLGGSLPVQILNCSNACSRSISTPGTVLQPSEAHSARRGVWRGRYTTSKTTGFEARPAMRGSRPSGAALPPGTVETTARSGASSRISPNACHNQKKSKMTPGEVSEREV
jgi:hypothetical protein